jgi:hypothetical protein
VSGPDWQVLLVNYPAEEAVQRLQALCGLPREMAERAVSEVTDAFAYDVDGFIAARHSALRARGLDNRDIYAALEKELQELRFRAPPLSARQLRRRIYG